MIRTLVSASSLLARSGLAAIVRADARLTVAGEATPRDLTQATLSIDADVLLEQRDGDEESGGLHVPTVSLVDEPHVVWTNEGAEDERGARAILARDAPAEEIVAAIVAVAAGLVALTPRALVPFGAAVSSSRRTRTDGDAERLTLREVDVLGELARGAPNKTIATRLNISEHTVKFHVASIFAKLGVSSRTEAVTHGVRLGLIML